MPNQSTFSRDDFDLIPNNGIRPDSEGLSRPGCLSPFLTSLIAGAQRLFTGKLPTPPRSGGPDDGDMLG